MEIGGGVKNGKKRNFRINFGFFNFAINNVILTSSADDGNLNAERKPVLRPNL